MFKATTSKIPSLLGSNTKFITLTAIIVSMAGLVPFSIPEQKAYSQTNNYDTFYVGGYFKASVPDSWTKVQTYPYIDGVETASASAFCAPEGCGEASLSLYAYLSTPGSFFPTGGTARPEDVFQGIINYNEGIGVHAIQVHPIEAPHPQVAVQIETTDNQGQKMIGMSHYLLSEQLGVLWEVTYYTKEGSYDYYLPIFEQINGMLERLYPTEVLCHEDQTSQCWKDISGKQKESYCTSMTIIGNIGGPSNFRTWDPYCQMWR